MRALLLSAILISSPAFAQDAGQILTKVAETYQGMKSFRFHLRHVMQQPPSDFRRIERYREPGRWRYDFQHLEDDEITVSRLSDGKTRWVYQASTNEYTEEPIDRVESSFTSDQQNIASYAPHATLTGEETLTVGDEKHDCYTIRAVVPSGSSGVVRTLTYWIDKTEFLVLQEVQEWASGSGAKAFHNQTTTTVLDYDLTPRMSPQLFTFKPPLDSRKVAALSAPPRERLSAGARAPAFRLPDLDGKEHDSAEFQGKYLLLEFWGAWCSGCREELPLVELIRRTFQGPRLAVLGISTNESPDTSRRYLLAHNLELPSWVDVNRAAVGKFGVSSFPSTFLIGPEGVIVYAASGIPRPSQLQEALLKAGLWPKN